MARNIDKPYPITFHNYTPMLSVFYHLLFDTILKRSSCFCLSSRQDVKKNPYYLIRVLDTAAPSNMVNVILHNIAVIDNYHFKSWSNNFFTILVRGHKTKKRLLSLLVLHISYRGCDLPGSSSHIP